MEAAYHLNQSIVCKFRNFETIFRPSKTFTNYYFFMANLWVRKPLSQLLQQAGDSEGGLKRTLGATNLVALGIGAIIGAGLFVRTAAAAAEACSPSPSRVAVATDSDCG